MRLDVEKYLPFLDGLELPREEKEEILRILWRMMEAQADKAFGLHPVQLVCGQNENKPLHSRKASIVSKEQSISHCYGSAANDGVENIDGDVKHGA